MKNYTITVNGTPYNVTVEEGSASASAPVASVNVNKGDTVEAGQTIITLA